MYDFDKLSPSDQQKVRDIDEAIYNQQTLLRDQQDTKKLARLYKRRDAIFERQKVWQGQEFD